MAYRTRRNRPFFSLRLRAGRLAPLAVLALMLPQTGASLADAPRQAPNSRVAMEVPESFAPSDRFSGFVDERSGASFLVVEMPAVAYEEVKTLGDKPEALAQKGILDTAKAALPGRSGDYVYITGKQKTAAGDYGKYIMVTRENDLTVMITLNVPQKSLDDKIISPDQIERAFASASVKAETAKGTTLFSLSYLGPFKETLSVMGNSKIYSPSGKLPEHGAPKTNQEPLFIVSPSVDKGALPDVKTAAQHSFKTMGNLSGQQVTSEKDVTVGGLKGYEIVGEGDDPKTGLRSGLYVVLLSGSGGGYYVMVGIAPATAMRTYLPEFQKIATGFSPTSEQ